MGATSAAFCETLPPLPLGEDAPAIAFPIDPPGVTLEGTVTINLPQTPKFPDATQLPPLPEPPSLPTPPELPLPPVDGGTIPLPGPIGGLLGTEQVALPLLARRSDFLLSLELGLDHMIDRFESSSSYGDAPPRGSLAAFGLGLGAAGSDNLSGVGSPLDAFASALTYSFATSLADMRRANGERLGAAPGEAPAAQTPVFNLWIEGFASSFSSDSLDSDGRVGVLYLGADYFLSPDILVGALVQYDDIDQDVGAVPAEVSARGWMAGPYAVVRLADHLFFQGRAAWGASSNDIDVDGAGEDNFDTDRWMVRGTLLGSWQEGPWKIGPRASVAYLEESQEAYTNSADDDVPSHRVSLGQAKFGSEFAYRFETAEGAAVEPSLLIEGVWNFDQNQTPSAIDGVVTDNRLRGRIEAGAMMVFPSGFSLGATASYDGLGSDDFEAIGGKVRARAPLN